MENKKNKRWVVLAISVLAIVMTIIIAGHTGLRKTEERIRNDMLKMVSRGDDYYDVRDSLNSSGYKILTEDRTDGFRDKRFNPTKRTGEMHIDVEIGEYGAFIKTYVFAYFAFDGDGKLVDIWIDKEIDTL